jgi:hypothetical protein
MPSGPSTRRISPRVSTRRRTSGSLPTSWRWTTRC